MLRESLNDTEMSIVQSYMRVLPWLGLVSSIAIAIEEKFCEKQKNFSRDVSHVARDSTARRKHAKRLRAQVYSRA